MPFYIVKRKSDGAEVTRYASGQVALLETYPLATYDHVTFVPDDPTPPPSARRIWPDAFRRRFIDDEQVAIELASLDIPTGTLNARAAAAQVRVWLDDVAVARYIDLADATKVRPGVQALEAYGLIANGRAAVILDTEPTADERYGA